MDEPVVHWIENFTARSTPPDVARILRTEEICRDVARSLGFSCVIIRNGVHTRTNQHAADGTVLTEFNAHTGNVRNATAETDPHITVYVGASLNSLNISGHIYIVWDMYAPAYMRPVEDVEKDRNIVLWDQGKKVVACECRVVAHQGEPVLRPFRSLVWSKFSFILRLLSRPVQQPRTSFI